MSFIYNCTCSTRSPWTTHLPQGRSRNGCTPSCGCLQKQIVIAFFCEEVDSDCGYGDFTVVNTATRYAVPQHGHQQRLQQQQQISKRREAEQGQTAAGDVILISSPAASRFNASQQSAEFSRMFGHSHSFLDPVEAPPTLVTAADLRATATDEPGACTRRRQRGRHRSYCQSGYLPAPSSVLLFMSKACGTNKKGAFLEWLMKQKFDVISETHCETGCEQLLLCSLGC